MPFNTLTKGQADMSNYEIYVMILCVIVFVLLTALSTACVWIITRFSVRLIRSGAEDERILAEHRKKQNKKSNKVIKIVDYAFSGIVCLVLVVVFICSLFVGCSKKPDGDTFSSAYRVVRTDSMARKNSKNTYLTENGLNDQIQTFDLIRTEKLPDEMELELYDIVVYETDDMLIIHRIVEIEEPNAAHPNCRYFRLQGDAIDSPDRFPVRYEQMRAIYRGDRTPFIGSFILFMQSPAGWICILLIVSAMIVSPILEQLLQKEKYKRLLLYLGTEEKPEEPKKIEPPVDVKKEIPRHKAHYSAAGRTGEVNIGTLNAHYRSGEVVDIHSLKHKKLISKSCKRVKILEKGVLDKALYVQADGFSSKALAAITQAGGKAIKVNKSFVASATEKHSGRSGGDRTS